VPTLDDLLLPTFAAQHWLVSERDVTEAGGTRRQIDHRLASGRWDRAEVGVYRLAGLPLTWPARVLAPILAAGPRAMASHACAAALLGIPGFGRGTPEISIERGSGVRRPRLIVHSSTDLARTSAVVREGIPTTPFDRTILDLGRVATPVQLLRAVEHGRRHGHTSWSDLTATLRAHARRGRPGVAALRQLIAAHAHRSEISDSDFELLVIALLLEHGLPEPVLHHRVMDGERFVAEVDLAYVEAKGAIELDGAVHLLPEVRERDLPRQNDLILLGWTLLRFTWKRYVQRPLALVDEVRALIDPDVAASG